MSKYKPGELVQTLVMSKGRGSKYWLPAKVLSQTANMNYNLEIFDDIAKHYMVAKDWRSVKSEKIRPLPKLQIGDRVRIDQTKNGYIRWIGCDQLFGNSRQTRYGVELDEARGFSDGTWKGKRFFKCNRWCGVFLKERERIILIKSSQPNSKSTLVNKGVVPKSAPKTLVSTKDNKLSQRECTYSGDQKDSSVTSFRPRDEEEKEIRETFKFFDTNKDKKIDTSELKNVMRMLGSEIDDAGVLLLLNDFDVNKNGTIEWDEFLTMMKQIGGFVS